MTLTILINISSPKVVHVTYHKEMSNKGRISKLNVKIDHIESPTIQELSF